MYAAKISIKLDTSGAKDAIVKKIQDPLRPTVPEFHPNSWRVNGNLKLFRVDMCSPWQKDGAS